MKFMHKLQFYKSIVWLFCVMSISWGSIYGAALDMEMNTNFSNSSNVQDLKLDCACSIHDRENVVGVLFSPLLQFSSQSKISIISVDKFYGQIFSKTKFGDFAVGNITPRFLEENWKQVFGYHGGFLKFLETDSKSQSVGAVSYFNINTDYCYKYGIAFSKDILNYSLSRYFSLNELDCQISISKNNDQYLLEYTGAYGPYISELGMNAKNHKIGWFISLGYIQGPFSLFGALHANDGDEGDTLYLGAKYKIQHYCNLYITLTPLNSGFSSGIYLKF